jgi:hypothetical protein
MGFLQRQASGVDLDCIFDVRLFYKRKCRNPAGRITGMGTHKA